MALAGQSTVQDRQAACELSDATIGGVVLRRLQSIVAPTQDIRGQAARESQAALGGCPETVASDQTGGQHSHGKSYIASLKWVRMPDLHAASPAT